MRQAAVHLDSGSYAIAWSGDAETARVLGAGSGPGQVLTSFYRGALSAPIANGVVGDRLQLIQPVFGTLGEIPLFQLHLSPGNELTIADRLGRF